MMFDHLEEDIFDPILAFNALFCIRRLVSMKINH